MGQLNGSVGKATYLINL